MAHMLLFAIAPISAVIALVFAYGFYKKVMKLSEGTEKMVEIAEAVRQGAKAYIRQQYKIVIIFFVVAALFLAFLAFVLKVQSGWGVFTIPLPSADRKREVSRSSLDSENTISLGLK